MAKGQKQPNAVSESVLYQIKVLKTLSNSQQPRQFHIHEICEQTGVRDEKEVQRHLFILEGQKLVSPHPEGDFTSKNWQITKNGMNMEHNLFEI